MDKLHAPRGRTIAAVVVAAILIAVLASRIGGPSPTTASGGAGDPEEIRLTGVVRDFRERTDPGGHPDFELRPDEGPLARPPARLAVYDVVDPDEARTLLARGADLVETFAIERMLEAAR